ncbi:glycoside hydrolase family 35 protein [Actinoplanes sp. CA-252034]|uniref:glycoside hydrolase family 35 protein n=1 Tax=Actinoplanes sp. CA-252034 TaxID=3239906 RepID=UPI003D990501
MHGARVLTAADHGFLLNDEPFQLIAGAMHYFRIHPDQWADRIDKARLMGLNSIDVYVPWNAHQPRPGEVVLDGILDLPRYLELIDRAGLHVVLRPGPYICAEWDGGGLPAWLSTSGVRLRSSDPAYLEAVDAWFDRLLPVVAPFLGGNGGPIIAVQVENEFGAYGPEDPDYLRHLADGLRRRGVTELLFTCDQAEDDMLRRGGLDGILRTVTFEHADGALEKLRQHQPTGPLMCAEFWDGWFDHWGGPHHTRDAADAAADLETVLAAGASVSLYMFHGGTNFGTTNGADFKHVYLPTITSYDYDAPLSEAGDVTEKYRLMRDVIARHAPVPDEPLPVPPARFERAGIPLDEAIDLFSAAPALGTAVTSEAPLSMEQLGEYDGFVLYETTLPLAGPAVLAIDAFADRAQIFVDGAPAGMLERSRLERALTIAAGRPGAVLSVLVENAGRVNYGVHMNDPKGLLGPVLVDGKPLTGWTQTALPLRDLTGLAFAAAGGRPPSGPAFRRGSFTVEAPADTFLSLPGWEQGMAWVNGFALGRYSGRGPQRTLFVPGPVLRPGRNEIVVLELKAATTHTVDLVAGPDLG